MLAFGQATTVADLEAILALQTANLQEHLNEDEKRSQGFLTISHSLDLLHRMNEVSPHIIAKADDTLAGFCLSMTQDFEQDIPLLVPMFEDDERVGIPRQETERLYLHHRGTSVCGGRLQRTRCFRRTLSSLPTSVSIRLPTSGDRNLVAEHPFPRRT
jgi:hypothetical protein